MSSGSWTNPTRSGVALSGIAAETVFSSVSLAAGAPVVYPTRSKASDFTSK
jgi:hypothetical protein